MTILAYLLLMLISTIGGAVFWFGRLLGHFEDSLALWIGVLFTALALAMWSYAWIVFRHMAAM